MSDKGIWHASVIPFEEQADDWIPIQYFPLDVTE